VTLPENPPLDVRRVGAPHILGFGRSPGMFGGFGIGSGAFGSGTGAGRAAGSDAVGYRPAPLSEGPPGAFREAASERWVRRIVDVVNNTQKGKLNVTLNVTLTPNATSTVITDVRISAFSALLFTPRTANAAVEQAAGGLYVSSQQSGQAVVEHANSAQSDREFRVVILA
jgi:hypothetical protein